MVNILTSTSDSPGDDPLQGFLRVDEPSDAELFPMEVMEEVRAEPLWPHCNEESFPEEWFNPDAMLSGVVS